MINNFYALFGDLTPKELAVVEQFVGHILGDGSIFKKKNGDVSFSFGQSGKHQAYFDHTLNELREGLFLDINTSSRTFTDKRYPGVVYSSLHWKTKANPKLRPFADLFMLEGAKVIPACLHLALTDRALAYWIMDDGSPVTRGGITLCTDHFSDIELDHAVNALQLNYGFDCTIHKKTGKNGNIYKRIYISRESFMAKRHLIAPYVIPSMLYKLHM